jgi:adenosine kinase
MNIVLTGSVAFDYLMTFPGYFREHILPDHLDHISLSFLVDSMVRRRGGIAPNIAYTLALLGQSSCLLATVGEDFADYRRWLEDLGVDTSAVRVIPGETTASFFANIDLSNAQIASFYPGAMAYASQLSLHELEGPRPDLVVISPNDPLAMIRYVKECQELGLPYLYDPSQQVVRLSDEDLCQGTEHALALCVNDYEFSMLQKRTGLRLSELLSQVQFTVVTRGEQGATIYTQACEYNVSIVPARRIVDPTGVGDAFRGGFLAGYARGWDWETCGRMGALAATYCLENKGPQGQAYTLNEFVARFRQHFDDGGKLDDLGEK